MCGVPWAAARAALARRGALSAEAHAALGETLRTAGVPPAAPRPALPPPQLSPSGDTLRLGSVAIEGITAPARPELVPEVLYVDSAGHSALLERMLKEWQVMR